MNEKKNIQKDTQNQNIFEELKKRNSNLLNLFNFKNNELLNLGAQAPSPSKDYCQLLMTYDKVIFRRWKIMLKGNSETRYPSEIKDSYQEFNIDDSLQGEVERVFGKNTLIYIQNITEKKKLDYITRLPENIILKIISFLELEDISRLSQVNSMFRQICRSDKVWMGLYKKYYSREITKELLKLAERDGWRKLFFTNKIKLQLELRRQAKTDQSDDSIYHTPRRNEENRKGSKSNPKKSNELYNSISNFRYSTFLTEN